MEIEEDQVFYMTISQTIIDQNIEDHACKRYPTSDFKNYEECDIKYMRCVTHDCFLVVFTILVLKDYLDNGGYSDLTPIWATNDSKNVTWKTEMEMSKTKIQVLRVIEEDYPFAKFF